MGGLRDVEELKLDARLDKVEAAHGRAETGNPCRLPRTARSEATVNRAGKGLRAVFDTSARRRDRRSRSRSRMSESSRP